MRKLFSFVLVFIILLSNFQVGVLYAENINQLKIEKDKSIAVLDRVETIIDTAVDKIDQKVKSEEIKERLEEKSVEIKKYLDAVEQDIVGETSKNDVKKIVAEAKKVVVLKVVSGATKQVDVEASISNEVADTPKEKEEALNTIAESLEDGRNYSLLIKTKYDKSKALGLFKKFDSTISLHFLYTNNQENYFEVFVSKDSIFSQEMLENIQSGNIPESFLGIEIITPEVFAVNQVNLDGEDLTQTWGIQKYNTPNYLARLEETGKKIRVGIVDTGIDYNHPDLQGKVSQGYDFVNKDSDALDDQGHGTHVSGTVGAGINGGGIIGVNPYVELIPLKICNARGFCPSYAVIKALEYAKSEKIEILNMSLGGRGNPESHPICSGISSVVESGAIVVAASGNSNINTARFVPGGCSDAITVAAVDSNGNRAAFSNYGSKVDVSAPGVQVYSTMPNKRYRKLSGTSMATPHIVGLISVMKSFDSTVDSTKVKELFKKFPLLVYSDTGKNIASSVDVNALMNFIQTSGVDEELIVEDPVSSTGSQNKVLEIVEDDAEINENIEFIKDQEIYTKNTKPEQKTQFDSDDGETSQTKHTFLDLGMSGSGVEINSFGVDNKNIISEGIAEKVIAIKENGFSAENVQYFGDKSKITADQVQINSVEEESLDEEEIIQTEDEFLDGAKAGVEINSNGVADSEELLLDEYVLPDVNTSSGDLDNKVEPIEQIKEDIEVFEHTNQIFIDGAQAGIEINNVGDNEGKESEEIVFVDEDELEGGILDKETFFEDGVELSDADFTDTELVEEVLNEGKGNIDVFVDGAQAGVEINSFGATQQDLEEVIVEEFSTGAISNIVEEKDIREQPELTADEQRKLAEAYGDFTIDISDVATITELDESEIENVAKESELGQIEELGIKENGVEINSFGNDDAVIEDIYIEEEFQISDEDNSVDPYKNLGDDEIIDIETNTQLFTEEEHEEEGDIGIQNTYYCTMTLGGSCQYYLYRSRNYKVSNSQEGVVNLRANKRYLYVYANGIGKTTLTYRDYRNREVFTLYVDVKPNPQAFYKKVTLELGKNLNIPVSKNTRYFSYSYTQNGIVTAGNSGNNIVLRGLKTGKSIIYVTERGKHEGTIEVEVKKPIIEKTIYVGEAFSQHQYYAYTCKYDISDNSLVDISTHYYNYKLTAKKKGILYLQVNNCFISKFTPNYILKLNIKEIPKPKEYSVSVNQGEKLDFHFPNTTVYRYYSEYVNGGTARMYGGNGFVSIYGGNFGTIKYKVFGTDSRFPLYILNIKVVPKVIIHNHSLYQGKQFSIKQEHGSIFSVKNGHLGHLKISGRNLRLYSQRAGDMEIYVKRGEYHVATYKINIMPIPVPQNYNITVVEGKTTKIYLPAKLQGGYKFGANSINGGHISASSGDKYVNITGNNIGDIELKVYSGQDYLHYYNINVKVVPKPATIIRAEVFEGKELSYKLDYSYLYSYSVSSIGQVEIVPDYHTLKIQGKKSGDISVYVKDKRGVHMYTYQIKVKAKPQPKVYTIEMHPGEYKDFYLPENIDYYDFSAVNTHIFHNNTIAINANKFTLNPQAVGDSTLYLREKSGNRFEKYIIHITIKPYEKNYSLSISEKPRVGYSSNDYKIVDPSIATVTKVGKAAHVVGHKVGNTTIKVYKNGSFREILHITVLPKPEPIKLNCTTEVGKECNFQIKNDGLLVTQSRNGVVEIDEKKNSFEVNAIKSGTVQIELKSWKGDYISHKIFISVKPRSVIVYDVETPLGIDIVSDWNTEFENNVYTFAVSNSGFVSSFFDTYNISTSASISKQVRLRFQGLKQGSTQVYLYKHGDHIATIRIKVFPAIPRIILDHSRNIDLLEGEQISFNILNGGGNYTEGDYNSENILFDIDNNHGTNAGTVSIEAKKITSGEAEEVSYAQIEDSYNQVAILKIRVKDANMLLNTDQFRINGGDTEYINIYNAFKGVKSIIKNNHNISATKGITEEGREYIIVKGQQKGTTLLKIEDYEGTVRIVKVEVGGGLEGGEANNGNTQGIRYIRDWANGSSSNINTHWIEIQALEKGTGKNVALGQKVSGQKSEPNSLRPYSWIVDGNTSGGNRAEGGVGENHVTIDLGKTYDVDTVKVLHYYPDGRTYYNTKTEVSVDGKNWTVLFDSAISGTYLESRDGSGRSYEVKGVKSGESEVGELEKELDKILKEFDFGSIKGIEVEDSVRTNAFLFTTKEGLEKENWKKLNFQLRVLFQDNQKGDKKYEVFENKIRNKIAKFNIKTIEHYLIIEGLKEKTLEKITTIQSNFQNGKVCKEDLYGEECQNALKFLVAYKHALISSLDLSLWRYYGYHSDELAELREKEFLLWADVFGLKNTGQAWGQIFTTVKANIEGDEYLLAEIKKDKELEASLNAIVKEDLSLLAKIQKVRKLANFLSKSRKLKNLVIGGKKVDADRFHREIKPKILKNAGKFDWKVGKNPDISVKNGKVILVGSSKGPFKNKSFETKLNFNDFIK